ncbi:putative major facilitator superfamily, sugar transporter (TC 2.A.1.1) family protein [Lyophyllum shimeji]|uniref:Major facilitator superfamily, sugar transporter (TC 2.A.1.1) family protein n=1 Tax=Lyophyllum shimeji TaxID=47721 RepID=A0A9P3PL29_LYOSH|nr:putative major facilitator superfamily, sugar transporter (TC 2.A.1.1) family protein [Lyophyllum shimeji]
MTCREDSDGALPRSAGADRRHTASQNVTERDSLLPRRNVKLRGTFELQPDGHSYTYSYGPTGIAGLLHNYYALACAFFASIGGLTFGYDQGAIANVLVMPDFRKRFPITPLQKGSMTALLQLGALVGALGAGTLADRHSRRISMFTACFLFCIGCALQGGAQSLDHLFIGRAVGGLGIGALSMLTPLYMAEISPPEVRGSLMSLEQFSIVLGVVLGYWTGFSTRSIPSSASWRIPLAVQLTPGAILGIGCCFFLPQSPRLLVLQGRYDDALHCLARLRLRSWEEAREDPLIQIELLEMRVEATLIQRALGDGAEILRPWNLKAEYRAWRLLFESKYRNRTSVAVLVMAFKQWSGINGLLYYGPTLVRRIGLHGDTVSLLVSGGIGIVQLVAVIPTILYIDQLGRKPLLRTGGAVMTVSHLTTALLVWYSHSGGSARSRTAWASVVIIYIFTAAYGISFGPIGWVLPSEVFPLSTRSKGVALATASNWLNNFFVGLVTPVIIDFSPAATFVTFAVASALGYLWSTYLVPETANVSLEEIDAVFKSPAAWEESQAKQRIEEELGLQDLVRELGAELGQT